MFRNFFFGSQEVKRNENDVPEMEDDQPRNKFTEIQILTGHSDLVDSLINIGTSKILSTGQDKKGVLWDCKTGEILFELTGHTRVITSVFYFERYVDEECCFPVIITASSDQTIRVWDVFNRQCKKVIDQHRGTVKCFCCIDDPDNTLLVSGGQDICLWDSSLQLLWKLQLNSLDYVHTAIYVHPCRIIAATDQPHLTAYNVTEQSDFPSTDKAHELKAFKTLPRHRESVTYLVCVSNPMFASASMDGAITLWSSNTLNVIRQFNCYENFLNICDHTYPYKVNHLLVADKRYIIAAIGSGFAVYDVLCDKSVARIPNAHHSAVTCVALVSNGSFLATSSLDSTVKLWAAPLGQSYEDLTHVDELWSISRLLGRRVLDMRSFPLKLELVGTCYAHSNSVKSVVSCGMEGFISCGNDGLVVFWKDAELAERMRDRHLRKVLADMDWLGH